jgi:hypothetical protein
MSLSLSSYQILRFSAAVLQQFLAKAGSIVNAFSTRFFTRQWTQS